MSDRDPLSAETRAWLGAAGIALLLAVIAGAVGSHALSGLEPRAARAFASAVDFHFFHALGLIGIALVAERRGWPIALRLAAWLTAAGLVLFCGILYARALGAPPAVGAVAPFGGVSFMLGWASFAFGAARR